MGLKSEGWGRFRPDPDQLRPALVQRHFPGVGQALGEPADADVDLATVVPDVGVQDGPRRTSSSPPGPTRPDVRRPWAARCHVPGGDVDGADRAAAVDFHGRVDGPRYPGLALDPGEPERAYPGGGAGRGLRYPEAQPLTVFGPRRRGPGARRSPRGPSRRNGAPR